MDLDHNGPKMRRNQRRRDLSVILRSGGLVYRPLILQSSLGFLLPSGKTERSGWNGAEQRRTAGFGHVDCCGWGILFRSVGSRIFQQWHLQWYARGGRSHCKPYSLHIVTRGIQMSSLSVVRLAALGIVSLSSTITPYVCVAGSLHQVFGGSRWYTVSGEQASSRCALRSSRRSMRRKDGHFLTA